MRRKLMLWAWHTPEWASAWLTPILAWTTCRIWGHTPQPDQCGNPDHDFCTWCLKATPRQATP